VAEVAVKKTLSLVAVVSLVLVAVAPAWPEEEGAAEQPAKPPVMTLGGSRSSSTWTELPSGTSVAVGKGVEWRGVRIHMALTWHLVAVDVKTGKVMWDRSVSAFWNEVGFAQVEKKDGAKVWAVDLRPGPRARRGHALHAYHDLATGEVVTPPGQTPAPDGEVIALRKTWHGAQSKVAKGFHFIVASEATWKVVRQHLWGEEVPFDLGRIDFERTVLLLISDGNSYNTDGVTCVGCWESDERILVRTDRVTYQTMGGAKRTRPWGAFVLPLRMKKPYVVERNVQGLIGGPPIWEERWRWLLPEIEKRPLVNLPPQSETPHEGWER
jgi:hypothetical protein